MEHHQNTGFKKILIIKLSSLGDIIQSFPVSYNLKKQYPDAQISWLTRSRYKDLLEINSCVDKVILINNETTKPLARIKELFRIIKIIRSQKFDIVLDLHCVLISNFLAFMSSSPLKLGLDKNNDLGFKLLKYYPLSKKIKMHRIEMYLSILRLLGLHTPEVSYSFRIPPEAKEKINQFLDDSGIGNQDRIIALHPGASIEIKRWGVDNFSKVANELVKRQNTKIIVIYSNAEKELAEFIRKYDPAKKIIIAPAFNAKELAEFLKRCSIFIGNESGPLHLAVAMGTATVSVVGPSDPDASAQYKANHHKIVRNNIPCSPCYSQFNMAFKCRNKTRKCLDDLSYDTVLETINNLILQR